VKLSDADVARIADAVAERIKPRPVNISVGTNTLQYDPDSVARTITETVERARKKRGTIPPQAA
jgi:hypothetical protein